MELTINGTLNEIQQVLRALRDYTDFDLVNAAIRSVTHVSRTTDPKPWNEGIIDPALAKEVMQETPHPAPLPKQGGEKSDWLEQVIQPLKLEKKTCPVCDQEFAPKVPFQEYCTPRCYQKKYYKDHHPDVRKPRTTKMSTGKNEPAPGGLEKHCHQCGTLFHPKRENTKFCSKRCYMLEWNEVHKIPKSVKLSTCGTFPQTVNPTIAKKIKEEITEDIITAETLEPAVPTNQSSPKLREEQLRILSEKLKKIKENDPAPTQRPDISRNIL